MSTAAIKSILFDLDGTVTDPRESITGCVAYTLRKFGIIEEDLSKLNCFNGPPLVESFREFYGFTEEQAQMGLKIYREEYIKSGLKGNSLYSGMDELLKELKARGKRIMLATSKPLEYAEKILEMAGVLEYFDFLGGNDLKESRPTKEMVIRYVLEQNEGVAPENTLMVGDRKYDTIGAHALGLRCVGVLYGYGSRAELEACGTDYLVESVAELKAFLSHL